MFDDEEDFYKREKESEGRYYSIKVKIRAITIQTLEYIFNEPSL